MGSLGRLSLSRSFWSGLPCCQLPSPAADARHPPPKVQPFEAIPRSSRNAWLNLYQFWRNDSFQNFHYIMERNFRNLGPIYRETVGSHDSVNVMLPSDAAQLFQTEGIFPRRMGIDAWTAHRRLRNHRLGLFLLNGEEWRADRLVLNREVISPAGTRKFLPFLNTVAEDFAGFLHRQVRKNTRRLLTVDLYQDVFRFTLEASSYALYGERLGLLEDGSPSPENERFIQAVQTMLETTLPLLFVPPGLMRWVNHKVWHDHLASWDTIFTHADKCIQNIYQEHCLGEPRKYSGIMAELLLKAELSLDAIKANITELTAGGVDTTAIPLIFTLFELARNPQVQTALREEIKSATAQPRELSQVLNDMPLLKGAIKETLRLYPVGITVQRYPMRDVVLQNYCVPAGTLCQVGIYAMGRSPKVFEDPECYNPKRWLKKDDNAFKALAFGFGARQCIGRRLAEAEMMLFLLHSSLLQAKLI
uniref:steroid 11beta-monooxygenase n=1 Tax=Salvator merianae TaxID=96440 RepID=A0A8D0DNX6_SALMN